jgi:hypothetical protein
MSQPRNYKGWIIEKHGGFITLSRFTAIKDDKEFWMFKLKEVKEQIDKIESGECKFEDMNSIYLKALYN